MAFEIHKSPKKSSHVFLKFQNCGFKAFTLKELNKFCQLANSVNTERRPSNQIYSAAGS